MNELEVLTYHRKQEDRSRRRKRAFWITAVLLVVGGGTGWFTYLYFATERSLQAAIAQADQLDPGWRMHEIEGRRKILADDENSALAALAARKLMPPSWPFWDVPPAQEESEGGRLRRQALSISFSEIEAPILLNRDQVEALRKELNRGAAMIAAARKLAEMPEGRYPIAWSRNYLAVLLPHIQEARNLAGALAFDVLLRAQEDDSDGALTTCRAILNIARSIGDEQTLISQLVRISCNTLALYRIERVLTQGQASTAELTRVQEALAREAEVPFVLHGLRGDRAGVDSTFEMMQTGELPFSQVRAMIGGLNMIAGSGGGPALDEIQVWLFGGSPKSNRAAMLSLLTAAVEAAKLPPEEQRAHFKQFKESAQKLPVIARMLAPAYEKLAEAGIRATGDLRCGAAAVAAERYRLANGRWPDSLDALVPTYLAAVPKDPYDGQPLRFKQFEQGILVYDVGPDGEDNGGKLDHRAQPKTDRGVKLFDPAKRRQPAIPLPVQIPDESWWEHVW